MADSQFNVGALVDPNGPKNPFAPYQIGAPHGLYVGVPNDYQVQTGVVQAGHGFQMQGVSTGYDLGHYDISPQPQANGGFQMGGVGSGHNLGYQDISAQPQSAPVYSRPIYTIEDVQGLRGQDPQQIYEVQKALYNAHYLTSINHGKIFDAETETALGRAMGDANVNGMTLPDMFDAIASGDKSLKLAGKGGSASGGSGSGPRDITSTSVSLTGRAGAQQVLQNALAQQLGREPTPQEVTRFMSGLNAEEKANPSVTHTHIGASGANQSSTTTQSSVDAAASALEWSKSEKSIQGERKKYQDSTYFDILHSMLSGGT